MTARKNPIKVCFANVCKHEFANFDWQVSLLTGRVKESWHFVDTFMLA